MQFPQNFYAIYSMFPQNIHLHIYLFRKVDTCKYKKPHSLHQRNAVENDVYLKKIINYSVFD